MRVIGHLLSSLDAALNGAWTGIGRGIRALINGPLSGFFLVLIIGVTGLVILLEGLFRWMDRVMGKGERVFAFVALLAMSLLVFNGYLQDQLGEVLDTDLGGLWNLQGQQNLALLLMVVVGFVGGSLATQEGKHLAVDATARVLSPASARFVKRLTSLVAAGLCYALMTGFWRTAIEYRDDAFSGLDVWSWMAAPLNAVLRVMPGERYGPGMEYTSRGAWEDAQFDAGVAWDELPVAFQVLEAGDRFPLWFPFVVLSFWFGVMGLRFLGQFFYPKAPLMAGDPPQTKPSRRPLDVVLAGGFPGALLALGLGVWWGHGALIVISGLMLVFLGAPLFVGVGVGTLAAWALLQDMSTQEVAKDMFEATARNELLAIPLFVLAGSIMAQGTMAKRIVGFARALLGPLPGGLGVAAVLGCAFFAAIAGSSPVTVIAVGSILFPMLVKEGYSRRHSMGLLTTAGGLGIVIPPSIPMIVYAAVVSNTRYVDPDTGQMATVNVQVRDLFLAGVMPGLFIAAVLMLYSLYMNWPRGATQDQALPLPAAALQPPMAANQGFAGWATGLLQALRKGFLSLLLPVLILGGIYNLIGLEWAGIPFSLSFGVVEAAAFAVVFALVVELLVHRDLKLRDLPKTFVDSAIMLGSLFLVLVIAMSLNKLFSDMEIPQRFTEWMMSFVTSPLMFLLLVNLLLLALGCVMDILSAILIVAPLLAPVAASYGIHPLHFAIIFIVNLEIGYMTPPLGINLFVASSVFERPVMEVIRAILPFLLLMLGSLFVLIAFPDISLWLVE